MNRRALLGGGLAACLSRPAWGQRPDLVVSAAGRAGTIATIGEAIERGRGAGGAPFLIAVEPGVYSEKLTIDVPNVTISGTAPGAVLEYAAGAQLPSLSGRNWGTSGSATLTVAAPDVTIRDLAILNGHDHLRRPMQAVALAVSGAGPRTRIERCRIESWQDTLLIQAPTLATRSRIAGSVDFVFGGGAAWLDRCEIVSRHVPNAPGGFIAAPSTPASQPCGLVFDDCRLLREPDVADDLVYLGRPWRAGGDMALLGHAAFLRCWMDAHIRREGWASMGYRDPAGFRRQLRPEDARLFEWRSRGPGARTGPSRRTLTDEIGAAMTPVTLLGGWAG